MNRPAFGFDKKTLAKLTPEERRFRLVAQRRANDARRYQLARVPPGRKRAAPMGAHLELVYLADEVEFMLAMDRYKRDECRPFPTWCEVLHVLLQLGYRKVEEAERSNEDEGDRS